MAKRQFNRLSIDPQQAGWDSPVNTNFERIEDLIESYPFPVFETTGALPTASDNDRALAFKQETSGQWSLYFSDGTSWIRVATLADDFIPALADITKGAESGDNIDFTIQVKNPRGEDIARRMMLDVWISTSDFGAPGGAQTVTVITGTQIDNPIANQRLKVLTNASGQAVVRVNVAGAGTRYVMASIAASSKSLDGTWAA